MHYSDSPREQGAGYLAETIEDPIAKEGLRDSAAICTALWRRSLTPKTCTRRLADDRV
jgi:hypothetical protein